MDTSGDITSEHWGRLTRRIADTMGLDFPPERRADLRRGLTQAARELGCAGVTDCVDRLVSAPIAKSQVEVLARHLTVGETYFFRDRRTFDVIAEHVLPELIERRRGRNQRLRFWSAACCTGEEPYSLAILLHEAIPDLADWEITILATDLNVDFLDKAAAASYGRWSFRDVPPAIRARYFQRDRQGRYTPLAQIRKLVTFAPLNLVDEVYPSITTGTHGMDVIFCRNALMYFEASQARRVVGKLNRSLVDGGWLAVGPSESGHGLFQGFTAAYFPGAILYRNAKGKAKGKEKAQWFPALPLDGELPFHKPPAAERPAAHPLTADNAPMPGVAPSLDEVARTQAGDSAYESGALLYRSGQYRAAVDRLISSSEVQAGDAAALALLVRSFANLGALSDALAWSRRWMASDKLNPACYYLRAMVLLEQGEAEEAAAALKQSLYLDPGFVLAHFALGNIMRDQGKPDASRRHFTNALRLLRTWKPAAVLPESDGLTAGRLIEIITAASGLETPAL